MDDILVTVPKATAKYLSHILSLVINHSLDSGIFPNALKVAKIIPILKSGNSLDPSNYRPISLLNYFYKIFEKVIHNRLLTFFEKFNIIYEGQYGFRKFHSTEAALVNYIDKVSEAFDSNKYAMSIFLDLTKAFDTVDHLILLSKLSHYGIRGTALDLLKSYLTNRVQYVQMLNHQSTKANITHGVPQGSVLGPLLFLIYINDICNVSTDSPPLLFVDDTTLTYVHNNLTNLTRTVNNELSKFHTWLSAKKLSLNIAKTTYILFQNHKKMPSPESITINNIPIK